MSFLRIQSTFWCQLIFDYFRLTFLTGLLSLSLFAWKSGFFCRSKATSIMQGKASLSGTGSTTLLTLNPFQTSHAKCPMHAGHGISWRFALPVPKARPGRHQGWSWGFPQRSHSLFKISVSRGKEGLAQGCLLQAIKQGLRVCISYPDSLFPVAHPRDLLSLSLHHPLLWSLCPCPAFSRQPSPSSSRAG